MGRSHALRRRRARRRVHARGRVWHGRVESRAPGAGDELWSALPGRPRQHRSGGGARDRACRDRKHVVRHQQQIGDDGRDARVLPLLRRARAAGAVRRHHGPGQPARDAGPRARLPGRFPPPGGRGRPLRRADCRGDASGCTDRRGWADPARAGGSCARRPRQSARGARRGGSAGRTGQAGVATARHGRASRRLDRAARGRE